MKLGSVKKLVLWFTLLRLLKNSSSKLSLKSLPVHQTSQITWPTRLQTSQPVILLGSSVLGFRRWQFLINPLYCRGNIKISVLDSLVTLIVRDFYQLSFYSFIYLFWCWRNFNWHGARMKLFLPSLFDLQNLLLTDRGITKRE